MNRLFLPVLVLALAGLSCAEVGVVVELPNGSIIPRCVSVPDGSSAYRILRSTGLETEWSDDGPWGRALCKIEGVGSEPVGTACSDWNSYWAFSLSLNRSDGWTCHSPVGFTAGGCWNRDYRTPSYEGHYCARDGDVLGFHFTDNFPSGYPEFLSFADICGEKPNRGPVQKKILQSSRPFWRRYAEDCGIEYTDRIPPQNLARRCREHRAEQQKAEEFSQKNNTDIIAEGFGGSSLRGVEYDYCPKVITDLKKPFTVILTSMGKALASLPVFINGREYTLGVDGSVSFPVRMGAYRFLFSQPGFEELKITFLIGG